MSSPAPGRPASYRELNQNQQRFVDGIMLGYSQKKAAIEAGYSAKSAARQGNTLINNPRIRKALAEARIPEIAAVDEVQRFLTHAMRGKMPAVLPGDRPPEFAEVIGAEPKDRIRSAELLGKSYALFKDNLQATIDLSVEVACQDMSTWSIELAEEYTDLLNDFAQKEGEILARVRLEQEAKAKAESKPKAA